MSSGTCLVLTVPGMVSEKGREKEKKRDFGFLGKGALVFLDSLVVLCQTIHSTRTCIHFCGDTDLVLIMSSIIDHSLVCGDEWSLVCCEEWSFACLLGSFVLC